MSGRRKPPAGAGWLLDRLDPSGSIRGDLDEEYLRFRRPDEGAVAARLWYWGQVVRTLPRLLRRPARSSWAARRLADLGQASRAIRRRPGPSALAVLTLGLGLGVNVAVFSLVNAVVLRPLPFDHEDRLVRVHPDELFYVDQPGARALADEATTFERALPWGRALFTFTGSEPAEEIRGALVAWDHFDGLGTRPALGRGFREDDARATPSEVVVVSHDLWVRRFGADPAAVGRPVEIDGRPRTLIGVLGPGHVPMEPDWDAWAPLPLDPREGAGRPLAVNALLRPGVGVGEARDDVRRAFAAIRAREGEAGTEAESAAIRVVPLRDHLLGAVDLPLKVLFGAVVAVLLLACANVANLRLAQGTHRRTEMAVRVSLGADRSRIMAQLIAESLLLAAAGAAVALALTWLLHAWGAGRLPVGLPRASQWTLGGATVAYTALSAAAAGILAGVLPAWNVAAGRGLAARARAGAAGRDRFSGPLVAAEVAGSVLLLVGAGLMLRSFSALRAVDPGFDADGVVALRVVPSTLADAGPAEVADYWERVMDAAGDVPGIEARGGILFLPMTPGGAWTMARRGDAPEADTEPPRVSMRVVTPGYFETLGIDLRAGRRLGASDGGRSEAVAVVNESLARLVFGGDDPVGRLMVIGRADPTPLRVVGVVGDVRQSRLRDAAVPELYRPLAQSPVERLYLAARTAGPAGPALAGLVGAVAGVDDGAIVSRAVVLDELVGDSLGATPLVTQLLTIFGAVALVLGAVGVYGVTASAVARRRREIGIRKALGAPATRVAGRTMVEALLPVAAGLLSGTAVATVASGLLDALLFGIDARDPLTFLVVPLVLGCVAVGAVVGPILRASRVDPARTLGP